MNSEQEKIAEQVIQSHRDNNGIYDLSTFQEQFPKADRRYIIDFLVQKGLIKKDNSLQTNLTPNGVLFKSFESERTEKYAIEDYQNKKRRYDLSYSTFNDKAKYITLIILIIGVVFTGLQYFKKERNITIQMTPKELKQLISIDSSEIRVDTLLKKDDILPQTERR